MSWINTYTGRRFDVMNPNVDQVCLTDIAHALSLICRFTGHTERFYSVAQHSVLVSQVCDPADALEGLFHDATEAYLSDLSRPVKHDPAMIEYRAAEQRLHVTIMQRFNLRLAEPPSVKTADMRLVANEAHQLLPKLHPDWTFNNAIVDLTIDPWSPLEAECRFYRRFAELIAA